jgi:hypothetical protein
MTRSIRGRAARRAAIAAAAPSAPGFAALLSAVVLSAAVSACGGKGPAGPAGPGASPPANQAGELKTAEAVMEASLAAQGGRERMSKLTALRQTGMFQMPQMGVKGALMAVAAAPQNLLVTIELPGLGKIQQGISGDVVWEMNPMTGARIVTGEERIQMVRESAFNADLIWKQNYPKAELAGVVEFAGQPTYKVVLTAADGDVQTRYISKSSLLPVGSQWVVRSQMGRVPFELEMSDWREVGGIKYPFKTQRKEGPTTLEILVEKIEQDPPLDPATFALPPEIAALQKPGA